MAAPCQSSQLLRTLSRCQCQRRALLAASQPPSTAPQSSPARELTACPCLLCANGCVLGSLADGAVVTANGSQQRGRQSQSQQYAGRSSPPPTGSAARGSGGGKQQRQWSELSGVVEYGVVASVKEGKYAFINCADRDGPELFFHLSDLTDPSAAVQRGDEVSFVVCCDTAASASASASGGSSGIGSEQQTARLFAKRVSRLTPGTVSFERVDERGVQGVIEAELKRPGRGQRGAEGYGGRIRRSNTANDSDSLTSNTGVRTNSLADGSSGSGSSGDVSAFQLSAAASYEFAERDLVDWPCQPAVGDRVAFDVFTEKRSNRQGATAVRLVALSPATRQRGTVTVLKDGYGFIRPEDAPAGNRELFFHFSALLDSNYQPAIADEIQFDTQRDEQQGRLSAQRITVLPKGSIKRDSVAPEKLVGLVDRDFVADSPASGNEQNGATASPPASSSTLRRSAIRYYPSSPFSLPPAPDSVDSALLEFTSSDCRDARPILLRGDTVTFQVQSRVKTGEKRCVNVSLLQASSVDREQGKVVSVNAQGGFAFIRRTTREGELFMHASNYKQQQQQPDGSADSSSSSGGFSGAPFVSEGAEVEYSLWLADNGRLCAVRGVPLAPGSVSFERVLDGLYRGLVIREPRRRERARVNAFERQRSGGDQPGALDERGEIRISQRLDSRSHDTEPLITDTPPFTVSYTASSSPQPLLVGDSVDCRVAVHNWSGQQMARDVAVHQLRSSPSQERGVVQQLPGANSRQGRVVCQQSGAVLPFDLSHFLRSSEAEQLTVGDSVQFDCVEVAADSASRRSTGGGLSGSGGKDRRVAARLSLLPHGSVQLDLIDRSLRFRGRVEDIPSNPKSNKQTAGHIFVLSTHFNHQSMSDDSDSGGSSGSTDSAPHQTVDGSVSTSSDTSVYSCPLLRHSSVLVVVVAVLVFSPSLCHSSFFLFRSVRVCVGQFGGVSLPRHRRQLFPCKG